MGEHLTGIARLLQAPTPPPELAPYLDLVRAMNGGGTGGLRWYPGSPRLIRGRLRPVDRLIAVELHPGDAVTLAAEFRGDRQVKICNLDGYAALKAMLPPAERRGVVLVDPAFEQRDEFARMAAGLKAAHRRWATGIYALWYPIKDRAAVDGFHRDLGETGIRHILAVELMVRSTADAARFDGCGLVVVNPPWMLPDSLARVLPFLERVLALEPGAGYRVAWLAPE